MRRTAYGLSALFLVTPFDYSVAWSHTTLTLPKAVLLTVALSLGLSGRFAWRAWCRTPLFWSAVALCAATALTLGGAAYHEPVLRETAKMMLYVLTLGVGYSCYRSDPDARLFAQTVALLVLVVSIAAIVQEWTGAPSVFRGADGLVPRVAGPLEGPNQLAGFFDLSLTWLIVQGLRARGSQLVLLSIALGLGILTLCLTFSRGGLVAVSLVAVLVLCLERGWLRPAGLVWWGSSLAGLICALWLAHGGSHLLSLSDQGDTGALGHRSQLWRAAWFFWRHHPWLGIGAGNFEWSLALAGYPRLHDHANSLYLQALAEGGIVLFAATLGVFVTIGVTARRVWRSASLVAGALFATLALAIHQSVDLLVFYPKVGMVWWILLGVALGSAHAEMRPAAVKGVV